MKTSSFSPSRPILFALSLATACSAAACLNTVTDGGEEETGLDAASIRGAKKNALAIFLKDLPPLGGGSSSGSSVTSSVSTGSWGSSSSVATSSVATSTGSWTATTTAGVGGAGGWGGGTTSVSTVTVGSGGGCDPGPVDTASSSVATVGVGTSGAGGAGGWGGGTSGGGTSGSVTATVGSGWEGTASSVSVGVGGGCDGSSSSGGPTIDPNTLYLMAGSRAPVCSNPFASGGCGSFHISIGLPPALQHKGTIALSPALLGGFFEQGPDEGGGSCWFGGGGSLNAGTLTILKINRNHVTFRLDGTSAMFSNAHADGTYEADLCGP
jgi:hypothetical protein